VKSGRKIAGAERGEKKVASSEQDRGQGRPEREEDKERKAKKNRSYRLMGPIGPMEMRSAGALWWGG
jgi:hypothetical protein